ncbi:phosphate signaling complex protein PhoU [Jannaschia sp. W003]|uniref:phosphate signaling complex protein PhoU n=1 Tax=Jannaschia sp. W003 TaxID=2867012 RepID=UPI0021A57413|nr:phosphate signaling complex protein PhoU [Jannaschia sp. W003]UWQ21510.1 phosphate signaling complex protein PhoU [Jannaschia sp. W003]
MTQPRHIASAFDRDLKAIKGQVAAMGEAVAAAIGDAATAYATMDAELAARTRAGDKRIDAMEEAINEEAAKLIALRQPIATDLRTVLAVFRISSALERIGDYAKNMAKRTEILIGMPPAENAPALRRMAREVEAMLRDVLDAYDRRDADLAAQVRARDEEVDQLYNGLFREYLTYMMEDPRSITACMHMHFMAKNIERMGDLVTGIAEQIIYLVTGEMPAEERTKADMTSVAEK